MAGVQVPILRKTTYTFPPLGNQQAQLIILAQLVDTVGWSSGVLLTRQYSKDIDTNGSVQVGVQSVMVAPEDPAEILVYDPTVASETIAAGSSSDPVLLVTAFDASRIGRYARVVLVFAAGSGTAQESTITLGVDLVGRSS